MIVTGGVETAVRLQRNPGRFHERLVFLRGGRPETRGATHLEGGRALWDDEDPVVGDIRCQIDDRIFEVAALIPGSLRVGPDRPEGRVANGAVELTRGKLREIKNVGVNP